MCLINYPLQLLRWTTCLPAWLLHIGVPVFCKPLACLLNRSLTTSSVPRQWKSASNLLVPKILSPLNPANYRPISITPVLCRRSVLFVREFLYPAILDSTIPLSFADLYVFRPTESTTAVLIALLQTISDLLTTDPFVTVIALDFSKAFDNVKLTYVDKPPL